MVPAATTITDAGEVVKMISGVFIYEIRKQDQSFYFNLD